MSVAADALIASRARRQYGAFTRRQALADGVSDRALERRVAAGVLRRAHGGVFVVTAVPPSWHQDVMAASLAVEGSAVSHLTAAALMGFPGFPPTETIDLLVAHERRPRAAGIRIHRSRTFDRRDLKTIDAIPVTSAGLTLVQIAPLVSSDALESALDEGLRRKLVSVRSLGRRLEEASGRPGAGALRDLVAARRGGRNSESDLETEFLRLLRKGGLPLPERQYEVRDPSGRLLGRVDLAYPAHRIFIEVDGLAHHSGRTRFDGDRLRQNEIVLAGWLPLRFTATDIRRHPEATILKVRRAIATRDPWGGVALSG